MSAQYVVIYTEGVHYNPYKVTKGVLGPFDSLGSARDAAHEQDGEVYRLDARLDECPGCRHPECSIYLAQWGRGK